MNTLTVVGVRWEVLRGNCALRATLARRNNVSSSETSGNKRDFVFLKTFVGFHLRMRSRGLCSPLVLDEHETIVFYIQCNVGFSRTASGLALSRDWLSNQVFFQSCPRVLLPLFRSSDAPVRVSLGILLLVICQNLNLK